MADLRIELLGGFRVAVGARIVPEDAWSRRRPAAVVKLLALAPGHRLHREQVMDALWPDLAPAAAAANLRKALHHARRSLDPDTGGELIASVGELLSLRDTDVDVDAFRAAASKARRSGDAAAYDDAVELYTGDLLPDDLYEEWTFAHRDELKADYVALLGESAPRLEACGELERAARVAAELVALEPLNEDGHLLLIRLNALAGRRGEAVQRYEQLRALLADELGAEPSPQAQRLYEDVRARQANDPALSADLWERVGRLRIAAGDTGGAVKAFTQALGVGGAPEAGRLHRQAAQALLMQHDADAADAHLQAAEAADPDPAEQGRLLCLRANQAWERGQLDVAQASAEHALELAAEHGEPDDVAAAQEALAIVSHFRGDWRSGLEAEIGRLGSGGLPALGRVFDIHHCIGQYHLYGDGLSDGVEAYARRVLELAERDEVATAQAFAWCLLGESLLLQARWEEAAGCLERSCELHASFGTKTGALPWQRLAELAVCSGAPDEAEAPLRRASAIATVSPMALHMWGRIYATAGLARLERGDPEGAARAVRSAAAAAARYGSCPSCSALLNPVAAEAFGALDDRDSAAAYAESASGVAGFFASSAWSAMAESAAASVAKAEHDDTRAQTAFRAAAELYGRAGQPYWVERSLAQAGGNAQGTPAS